LRPEGAESTLSLAVILALGLQAAAPDASAPVSTAPAAAPIPAPSPAPAAPAPAGPPILDVPPPFAGPAPSEPRRIDDLTRPLTGFVPYGSYEARVRGAVARAQNLQGPLDGAWLVTDAAGAQLFRFQLVDPGFSGGAIEGAWSDPRAAGAAARGFFTGIARTGTTVKMQFARPGAGASTLTLQPRAEGGYAGELVSVEVGAPEARAQVTMTRP
jgi:hypothetical protein